MTEEKPKTLKLKEAKLVKATVQGMNQTQAGLYADPNRTPESARVWANETLRKATVREALHAEMIKQGIDIASVVKPIADGLTAEKVSIVGNGEAAMAEVTPDHNIRIKAAQIAGKWMGLDASEGGGNTYNFINVAKQDKDEFGL